MENGWFLERCFGNPNVPANARIIGSMVTMSGEVITTYFATEEGIFRVTGWVEDKPVPVI